MIAVHCHRISSPLLPTGELTASVLAVHCCIGVSTQKYKGGDSTAGFELGVKPGLAIKLTDHFSLVTKYGFLGYRDDYMLGAGNGYGFNFSSEDLSIGFHYTF